MGKRVIPQMYLPAVLYIMEGVGELGVDGLRRPTGTIALWSAAAFFCSHCTKTISFSLRFFVTTTANTLKKLMLIIAIYVVVELYLSCVWSAIGTCMIYFIGIFMYNYYWILSVKVYYISVYLSVRSSIHPSVRSFVHPSVHLCVH